MKGDLCAQRQPVRRVSDKRKNSGRKGLEPEQSTIKCSIGCETERVERREHVTVFCDHFLVVSQVKYALAGHCRVNTREINGVRVEENETVTRHKGRDIADVIHYVDPYAEAADFVHFAGLVAVA